MTTIEAIDDLDAAGKIVWRNSRYDAVYATDLPHLEELLDAGYVPVLHLGQPEGIDALTRSAPSITWILVELWCPRDVAVERIVARATGDTEARIAAYDQTKRLATADIRLLTNEKSPRDCAEKIHSYVRDRL
ncbi:kinase [Rhodococcus pyridinivorans]|uniref:kinase n=1 Tax=Rhodococcus pyridinivorans TaxID=103816 RepID=UPI00265B0E98|nr:kinase [Rhodococcus pyridinivorans]